MKKLLDNYFFNTIILVILYLLVVSLKDDSSSLLILGVYNVILSIIIIIRFWKADSISLLVGMLMIINISYSSSVCINAVENARNWQVQLVNNQYNIINVKSYIIFITALSLMLRTENKKYQELKNERYNPIIIIVGFLFLLYALVFGVTRSSTYVSNSNASYEYAIVIYVITWLCTSNKKSIRYLLIVYAGLYILQGLMYGDRSSAFPMILVNCILLFKDKIKMKYVILMGLCGIIIANTIDVYRNNELSLDIFSELFNRGLNVNTISYSSYAGTQIIRYSATTNNHLEHFLDYSKAIFFGKTSRYNLDTLAFENGFINKGGGMSSSYFYYWGNYLGSFLGGAVFGFIINKIFNKKGNIYFLMQCLICAFSIRWIVYYPIAFFRTSIVIPFAIYLVFAIFTNMLLRKGKIFNDVFR